MKKAQHTRHKEIKLTGHDELLYRPASTYFKCGYVQSKLGRFLFCFRTVPFRLTVPFIFARTVSLNKRKTNGQWTVFDRSLTVQTGLNGQWPVKKPFIDRSNDRSFIKKTVRLTKKTVPLKNRSAPFCSVPLIWPLRKNRPSLICPNTLFVTAETSKLS